MMYGYGNMISPSNRLFNGGGGIVTPYVFASVNDLGFSIRKINDSYMGDCMRIRRSSDNSELDIGFVGGQLDTSAISAFCGVGIGYVAKWYDQSGNVNDLFNTTASNQPIIYNNGFTLINSLPYITCSPTQFLYLNSVYNVATTEDYTFFMVYQKSNTGISHGMLLNTVSDYLWLDYQLTQYVNKTNTITISSNYLANTLYLNNTISDYSASTKIYRNNTLIGSRGANTNSGAMKYVPANAARTTTTVTMSEFVFYKEDKTVESPDINANINEYFTIY